MSVTVVFSSTTTNSGASQNADVNVVKDVVIENGSSLEIMSGQKYVMQTGDILKVYVR